MIKKLYVKTLIYASLVLALTVSKLAPWLKERIENLETTNEEVGGTVDPGAGRPSGRSPRERLEDRPTHKEKKA